MKSNHLIPTAFKKEFTNLDVWWSRAVVVAATALAGLTVVGFTWLCEHATALFVTLATPHRWIALAWTPLCTVAIAWLMRRYAVGAGGSGIPQVMATLETSVTPPQRGMFVSLKLSLAKMALTAGGLLAGLSLGREGPSVQIAAGVMLTARRFLPRRTTVTAHGLLVAGGAAGIAAAFNAPLAGVMFAIEELSRVPEQRSSGLLVAAIVLAGMIAVSINGNATYFGVIHASNIGWTLLLPGLLVALSSGVTGGLFSRLLIASLGSTAQDRYSRLRRARPLLFAAGCALLVAAIGVVTDGDTYGSGYGHTRAMLEGSDNAPAVYVLFKYLATWLTVWSGVPAGIFAPSLAIGAALGNDLAMLTHYPQAPALIALGMVGFLAAATQAPLTAFIIVMEMVDGHGMVLSLMACDHFHHDDEGRQRRLRGRREEAHHAQRNQRRRLRIVGQHRQIIPQRRADCQRRREDPGRHARPYGQPGRQIFEQHIHGRRVVRAFQHGARVAVAAAVGVAVGDHADGRDQQRAAGREQQGTGAAQAAVAVLRRAAQGGDQQARKQAAGDAAAQCHQQAGQQQRPADIGGMDHAEVGGVAVDGDGDHPGQHDGGDQQAAAALLRHARQYLDGEHDAGQRRVERGGDAGRAAGHQQTVRGDGGTARQEAARRQHHAGGDLHRRAFTAQRQAGQQAARRQRHLGQAQFQRHEQAALRRCHRRFQRRHHLRDAGAAGTDRIAAHQPGDGDGA